MCNRIVSMMQRHVVFGSKGTVSEAAVAQAKHLLAVILWIWGCHHELASISKAKTTA